MMKKAFVLIFIMVMSGSGMCFAQENLYGSDMTFQMVEHKDQFGSIYYDWAQEAYLKGDLYRAKENCMKALRMNPDHQAARELLHKMGAEFIGSKGRQEDVKDVFIQEQQTYIAGLIAGQEKMARDIQALSQQNQKQTADAQQYKMDLQAAQERLGDTIGRSVVYQKELAEKTDENQYLRARSHRDFLEKEQIASAADEYIYVQKDRLERVKDRLLFE